MIRQSKTKPETRAQLTARLRPIVAALANIRPVYPSAGAVTYNTDTLDAVGAAIAGLSRDDLWALDESPGIWGYTVTSDGSPTSTLDPTATEWHWKLRQYRNRRGF